VRSPTAAAFRAEVETALAQGWRARSLYAADGGRVIRVLLTGPDDQTRLESVVVDGEGSVPSIVDLAPAMGWDEREAHDLYGVGFVGHEPLRPLLDHAAPLESWTVPVRGHDPYQVAVGPIHAGVIESGHFRFHVVGDKILHLDARLFYKHRGLERAAEGSPAASALNVITRACAGCMVANSVAFATAAEQTLGLHATSGLARARTFLLEIERVWNHLNDIAAICAGVGMSAGNTYFLALTERARRLNMIVAGHRFLFGTVAIGRSELVLDDDAVRSCAQELVEINAAVEVGWHELAFNASFQDRLDAIGVIDAPTVQRLGVVGPAARAAGVAEDTRTTSPYPNYAGFVPVTPSTAAGDVRARLEQRVLELRQSFDLLGNLLDSGPVMPAVAVTNAGRQPIGIGFVESPRGATSCVIECAGDAVSRVRLRTGSYANWPAVAHAAAGNLLPDFPLINKSFELCYACADR
jgi:Ni,Fe-hydrogenase III large subunit